MEGNLLIYLSITNNRKEEYKQIFLWHIFMKVMVVQKEQIAQSDMLPKYKRLVKEFFAMIIDNYNKIYHHGIRIKFMEALALEQINKHL